MKRISFRFFVIALTFSLGITSVLVWLNYYQTETIQSDSTFETKIDIAPEKPKTAASELAENHELWQKSKIVSYNFIGAQFAEGLYPFVPVQIKVANSKTISTKPIRKKLQLQRIDGYDKFDTFEKIFDEIRAAIDREDNLTVSYNKEFGFPEKISIKPGKEITSNYYRIEITEFEVIKTN